MDRSCVETGLYPRPVRQYCGTQHAKMLLRRLRRFEAEELRRLGRGSSGSRAAIDAAAVEGKRVFQSDRVRQLSRGRRARSAPAAYGPDLTHLMSRDTIASGIAAQHAPRTCARWIKDPESLKPGARMPAMKLERQRPGRADRLSPHAAVIAEAHDVH